MRAIVQRVAAGTVHVDGREVCRCGHGLLLLVGIHREDQPAQAKKLAEKIANLRIFSDLDGKMNLSLLEAIVADGEVDVLAVSNFTVYGDCAKSRRPSFTASAPYEEAETLFNAFVSELRNLQISVQTGLFGADMRVSLINDGPVTLVVDV